MRYDLRVLVFGGRDFMGKGWVDMALNHVRETYPSFVVVHGGAQGADRYGKEWAEAAGFPCVRVDAPWDFYKKAAGPIRNTWMLEVMKPSLGIMFPGNQGTADMKKKLAQAGVPVWEPMAGHNCPPMKIW